MSVQNIMTESKNKTKPSGAFYIKINNNNRSKEDEKQWFNEKTYITMYILNSNVVKKSYVLFD